SPVLTAASAYFVFRRLTGPIASSLVVATFYGFGPFGVGQNGHLHLVACGPLLPLILLVGYQIFLTQQGSPVWAGVWLGLLAAGLLLVAEEMAVMATLVSAAGVLLLAVVYHRQIRNKARCAATAVAVAAGVAVVLVRGGHDVPRQRAGEHRLPRRAAAARHRRLVDLAGRQARPLRAVLASDDARRLGVQPGNADLAERSPHESPRAVVGVHQHQGTEVACGSPVLAADGPASRVPDRVVLRAAVQVGLCRGDRSGRGGPRPAATGGTVRRHHPHRNAGLTGPEVKRIPAGATVLILPQSPSAPKRPPRTRCAGRYRPTCDSTSSAATALSRATASGATTARYRRSPACWTTPARPVFCRSRTGCLRCANRSAIQGRPTSSSPIRLRI